VRRGQNRAGLHTEGYERNDGAGRRRRWRLDDRVAPVTGASAGQRADNRARRAALVKGVSSGIGFAIAHMLLEDSFDVTISSSSEKIHTAAREFDGTNAVRVTSPWNPTVSGSSTSISSVSAAWTFW